MVDFCKLPALKYRLKKKLAGAIIALPPYKNAHIRCANRPSPSGRPSYSDARPPNLEAINEKSMDFSSPGSRAPMESGLLSYYGLVRKTLPSLGFDFADSDVRAACDPLARHLRRQVLDRLYMDGIYSKADEVVVRRELLMEIGDAICTSPKDGWAGSLGLDRAGKELEIPDQSLSDLVTEQLIGAAGPIAWFDVANLSLPRQYRGTPKSLKWLVYISDEIQIQEAELLEGFDQVVADTVLRCLARIATDDREKGLGGVGF